jgi:hypothetical protein
MTLPKLNLRDLFWLVVVVALACAWWFQEGRIAEARRLNTEKEMELRNVQRIEEFHQKVVDAYRRDGRLHDVRRADGSIYVTDKASGPTSGVFGPASE